VNLCQRLQQLADKGETVLSEATLKALKTAVDAVLIGSQYVKGRATPVTAYKIACRDGTPSAAAQPGPADPGPASNSTSRMGGLCLTARPH
jgi:class 3 adenylate cyclase